ncbi:MAG: gamma-glutamyl-gamma-aminobutyrate hydrolase family protein [Fimbriimonas sp.]|nr:gamma-glutamyl-gamma-aminobutyrate hydrolase family protein [Fimbriimonas sp.]
MKPLIAISVDVDPEPLRFSLRWNYAEQVALAGGNPLLISPLTDLEPLVGLIDGWLIPGGDDIDSSHFGQELHPKAQLQHPARWENESRLYERLPSNLPIFGICYGCQFLNVKRGGTLIQHVPDVTGHEGHSGGTMQKYSVSESTLLAQSSKVACIEGKSYHHQAVDAVGEGLVVTARAEDGIVEAIEDPLKPFWLGVQWHPERTPDDVATQNLFKAFIKAATEYRESKQ